MDSKYCYYLGTARGTLLYSCSAEDEKLKYEKPEHSSEVTALAFGRLDDEVVIGYENGNVNLYNTIENKYVKTLKNIEGSGLVSGIGCANKSLIIARQDGIINIWNSKRNDYFSMDLDENSTLNTMEYNQNRENVIGTGGSFNDFKLWDIETKQCIFKSKSLGHDELNLPIPTTIRGITFFSNDDHLCACATKEGHVLLYDDRAQRKPVGKIIEKKASYTTIAEVYRDRQCFVGTTRGYMQLLDFRSNKCLKTFTSFSGSVTGIVCDPVEPFVASISLDRHLRVHNIETKELVHKVYMKQNLTKVLIKPFIKDEPEEKPIEKEAVVDEEYEEIFNNMETIDDVNTKKFKRKSVTGSIKKTKKKKIKTID